jgi:hypothetical protein
MNWQPIETASIDPFDPNTWFVRGHRVLVWTGWAQIASYDYTKTGKGRWRTDSGLVISPSLWQPLPEEPPYER